MMSFVVKTTVTGRERPERVATILISDDFFRMLGVRPVAGRWFTPEEGKPGGLRVLMIG
jgi:hypothetical protein